MSNTILPISQPMIHGYNHYAHLLSILECHTKTLSWIYSNFIEVYMNKDLIKNPWGDFYYPFPYEMRLSDTCKWLKTARRRRSEFKCHPERLIEFIKDELESGYYAHMYLSHSHFISDMNRHDSLIYGIDMDEKVIYIADVFVDGKYEHKIITFEKFISAFNDCIVGENDFLQDMIYLYKVKDKCDWEFDICNIENSIIKYFNGSTPEYWNMYNCANRDNIVFGRDVYTSLLHYIDEVIAGNEDILDFKHFYLMMEHKKMLVKRFQFLCKIGCYDIDKLKTIIDQCVTLYEESNKGVNMIIKYNISKNKNILNRLKNNIEYIQQMEYKTLKVYIDNFIEHKR